MLLFDLDCLFLLVCGVVGLLVCELVFPGLLFDCCVVGGLWFMLFWVHGCFGFSLFPCFLFAVLMDLRWCLFGGFVFVDLLFLLLLMY